MAGNLATDKSEPNYRPWNDPTYAPDYWHHVIEDDPQSTIDALVAVMTGALWMVESNEGTSDDNDKIVDAYRTAILSARGKS